MLFKRNGPSESQASKSIVPVFPGRLLKHSGKSDRMKAYFVDTGARIAFYVPVIGIWELFAAGMEDTKVLKSRVAAVGINFVIGRVHGKAREFARRISNTTDESPEKRKSTADTVAGFVVGVTSYALMLVVAGATLTQSIIAFPFALIFTSLTGRPYGIFNDWLRGRNGLEPVYSKKKERVAAEDSN